MNTATRTRARSSGWTAIFTAWLLSLAGAVTGCGKDTVVLGNGTAQADAKAADTDSGVAVEDASGEEASTDGSSGTSKGDVDGSSPLDMAVEDGGPVPDAGPVADAIVKKSDIQEVDVPPGDGAAFTCAAGHCGDDHPPGQTCSCAATCVITDSCCPDYATVCNQKVYCGDSLCSPPESAASCAPDCAAGKSVDCLKTDCPWAYACLDDAACTAGLLCEVGCSDEACAAACIAKVTSTFALKELSYVSAECNVQNQCGFALPLVPQICGDGSCVKYESDKTCPQDCKPCAPTCDTEAESWADGCSVCGAVATTPGEICAKAKCPKEWKMCDYPQCRAQFACMEQANSLDICATTPQGIYDPSLMACAKQFGCLGKPGSCAGKCGQASAAMACKCDENCKILGNCCPDVATACPAVVFKQCGDGKCDPSLGESLSTCPSDCSAGSKCIVKANCGSGEVCCGGKMTAVCKAAQACQ